MSRANARTIGAAHVTVGAVRADLRADLRAAPGDQRDHAGPRGWLATAARDGADVVAVVTGTSVAARVGRAYGLDLAAFAAAESVTGRVGEVARVPVQAPPGLPARLLLVGSGSGSVQDHRRAAAALARATRGRRRLATTLGSGAGTAAARAVVEGLVLGGYCPPIPEHPRASEAPPGRIDLVGTFPDGAIADGMRHAQATVLARDLAEMPSNRKNPAWLAARCAALGTRAGLEVDVWGTERLADEGFTGTLTVGRGSSSPPRMVWAEYAPDGSAGERPVVLVGKGITFDTGGLSIKPREAMVPMKTDMAGAAAVLAAVRACAGSGVRRRVVGLLPMAENAVSGSAYRPSDVVPIGGRTVEVTNTDAEGRLILADAMAYAVRVLEPAILIDVATLTGAASLGLGRRHAALYATSDGLAAGLERAGRDSGEGVWRMPLVQDYRVALDSEVADVRQIAADPAVGAGSIVAALFLREFASRAGAAPPCPWAHLDIAGPARADKDEFEVTRGATGFGARLLLRWLESLR